MLAVSWDTVRLFLHVLVATVWVGGQLVLAALVPALRRFGADVTAAAARRFNQVAWTAFAVLIVTGIWNIAAVRSNVRKHPRLGLFHDHGSKRATIAQNDP
jgi:putative copper export protein